MKIKNIELEKFLAAVFAGITKDKFIKLILKVKEFILKNWFKLAVILILMLIYSKLCNMASQVDKDSSSIIDDLRRIDSSIDNNKFYLY